jgi:hypothetical protein
VADDRMQTGYSYLLTEPIGRNFDPQFRPELSPEQMLALGVFCGKYMTDCQKEFPASWFAHARAVIAPSTILVSTPVSRFRCGAGRAGFIPMIRAAGSGGIAATTWAAACRMRRCVRFGAGKRSAVTWHSRPSPAGKMGFSAFRCCGGRTITGTTAIAIDCGSVWHGGLAVQADFLGLVNGANQTALGDGCAERSSGVNRGHYNLAATDRPGVTSSAICRSIDSSFTGSTLSATIKVRMSGSVNKLLRVNSSPVVPMKRSLLGLPLRRMASRESRIRPRRATIHTWRRSLNVVAPP